jgi:integrase/recombinase XerD
VTDEACACLKYFVSFIGANYFLAAMKKKIILKRVFHHGIWRILISFAYDESLSVLVRNVTGIRYSKSHTCWYTDETEERLKEILAVFRDKVEIDISGLSKKPEQLITDNHAVITAPEVSKRTENLKVTRSGIEDQDEELIADKRKIEKFVERQRYGPVEFRINEQDGRLAIRFTGYYDQDWIREIVSYGKYFYDEGNKEFLLPWSVMTGDSLSDYFSSRGVEVRIIKSSPTDDLKRARRELGDEIRNRALNEKGSSGLKLMDQYLDEVRYSARTKESYLALLEMFFKYFNEKNPLDISMEEVSEFVYEFIITNGYSASYQNQMISAIKTFYRISGKKKISLELIERPRRSRALPKVFSKEEVKRILNSTRNTKHKLLLWIVYSCGLRRSEVTNILLTDLDRDRSLLHIREGKGRVDRIVPVSEKVWDKLDEYIDGYHPVKYLFEGQTGGKYSVESVYRVFKSALRDAGINKDVGVHSLRHSYATHLHETGLDIRYIQELLGHKSSRTTEIYTHVSRRNLIQVRSPIEDMDVK